MIRRSTVLDVNGARNIFWHFLHHTYTQHALVIVFELFNTSCQCKTSKSIVVLSLLAQSTTTNSSKLRASGKLQTSKLTLDIDSMLHTIHSNVIVSSNSCIALRTTGFLHRHATLADCEGVAIDTVVL